MEDAPGMTIDELAQCAGTSTRTVRLYQTKSLLPPPKIVGRVGYYSEMHLNRLRLIERLQRRGFSLAGIAELVKVWQSGKSIDELLGVEAALTAPWNEEPPERLDAKAFGERFNGFEQHSELLERAERLGIVVREDDGWLLPSPSLLAFGNQLVQSGMPSELAMRELELLREDTRRIAERFLALFRTHVLPNVVKGSPVEWLPRLAAYSTGLRAPVRALVVSAFTRAMDDAIHEFQVDVSRRSRGESDAPAAADDGGEAISADGAAQSDSESAAE